MSKEKDMLHVIAVEVRREKIQSKYKEQFDEMLAAAKAGKFSIRWHNTEEEFPQELAEYLFIDSDFKFYRLSDNKVFEGIIENLRPGWRGDSAPGMWAPGYVEVSWQ